WSSDVCSSDLDDIEKPNGVFLIFLLKIKIRIVTGTANLGRFDFRIVSTAHCLRKTNQLGFSAANRPIVTVTAERDDPLLGVAAFEQNVQPTFKPGARSKRPRRIDVRCLVEKRSDESIDIVRKFVEIDVLKLLAGLNRE